MAGPEMRPSQGSRNGEDAMERQMKCRTGVSPDGSNNWRGRVGGGNNPVVKIVGGFSLARIPKDSNEVQVSSFGFRVSSSGFEC